MHSAPFGLFFGRHTALPALIAALAAGAVYAITLGGTYVYDDLSFIQHDARLHDTGQWGGLWTEPYHQGVDILYRPVTSLSFALQGWLHGERTWALHLVNVLLHMGVAALVAELGRKLGGWGVGLVSGLLFAVHPVHVEAVAGLVGRAELLSGLGVLGALRLWMARPLGAGRAVAIVGLFGLAGLSKEQGMLLPLILIGALPWRGWGERYSRERRTVQLTLVALMVGFAGYVIWRENHPAIRMSWDASRLYWSINPIVEAGGADRWLLPVTVAGRYAALLVAPVRLSLDYGGDVIGPVARLGDPYLWVGIAALTAGLAAMVVAAVRRRFDLLLLLIGLGLSYGVVSNFVILIGTIMGERLMYLPSAFFVILAGYALCLLPMRVLWGVMAVLVGLGSWRTVSYAALWNQPMALYRTLMEEHPESARGYRLVAQELARQGDSQGEWEVLERGLARIPDDLDFWVYAVRRAAVEHDWARAFSLLDRAESRERARQARRGVNRPREFEEIDTWREMIRELASKEAEAL